MLCDAHGASDRQLRAAVHSAAATPWPYAADGGGGIETSWTTTKDRPE